MTRTIAVITWVFIALSCTTSQLPSEEAPDTYSYNPQGQGPALEVEMVQGEAHNHPLMAIWMETTGGKFLQTLYVSESIGKGVFRHGDASHGFWQPGEIRRPAALPFWSHRRGIRASDGLYLPTPSDPVPDAFTGPTPPGNFILKVRTIEPVSDSVRIYFEINQTWDWNEYWTNNKYPDDQEYKSSCQPALVYASPPLNLEDTGREYDLTVIGRSHHSGLTGELYHDLETMTTALHIADEIRVRVIE